MVDYLYTIKYTLCSRMSSTRSDQIVTESCQTILILIGMYWIRKATKANAWSAGPPVMAVSDSMTPAVSVAAAKTNGSRTNSTQKSPSAKMSAKERALNAVLQLVVSDDSVQWCLSRVELQRYVNIY